MRTMIYRLIRVMPALLVSLSVTAAPELKGTPKELSDFLERPAPTVSIEGRAEDSAYSDIAKITLIVSTESKLLSAALTANSSLRARITKEFLAAGITAENINTSKFSTSPQFGWFGNKPKSYEVVNRMTIEVQDESHLKAVAAAADNNPEIDFAEIEFEHSESKAVRAELLENAIEDVLQQKKFYEQQLGLTLQPVKFTAPNVRSSKNRSAPRAVLEEITVTARKSSGRGSAEDNYDDVSVTFDEIEYRAVVTVMFEIERPD
jgi:uncharacterized protein YggE